METDSTAFCLANALIYSPTMMRVTSSVLVSKNSPVGRGCPRIKYPNETIEKTYAAVVLSTISSASAR